MNHQSVEFDGIENIFPKCIARKRTNKDIIDKIILGSSLIGVSCWLTPKSWFDYLPTSIMYCNFYLVTMELLSRLTSFREEYSHLESRYKKSLLTLLKKLFSCNRMTYSLFLLTILTPFIKQDNVLEYINSAGMFPFLVTFQGWRFLTDIIELDASTVKEAKLIDRRNGIDYGSGMSHSCFYGYLKLTLPKTGRDGKGIKENLEDFASNEGVTFAAKKLFMLLPASGRCPASVADYSPRHILEECKALEPQQITRGGVKGRNYHNTVYKLHYAGEKELPLHVCVEFASALQTFYEVKENHHSVSEYYNEHQQEIVTNFFIALQTLIREKNYNNLIELIFFQDRDENGLILYEGENGLDIGDLILQKLNLPPIDNNINNNEY